MIRVNFITLVAYGEKHGLWNQNFLIVGLLDVDIPKLCSTLFLKCLSPCACLGVKDELLILLRQQVKLQFCVLGFYM